MKKQAITLFLILAGFTCTYAQTTIPDKPEVVLVQGGTFAIGKK